MISDKFKSWTEPSSSVKVYQITDGARPAIHRFYDTSPISPSGRYIALTEFPFDDRLPSPGDRARVFVVDLHTGDEVYSTTTAAWDTQVGAHAQWGKSDECVYFNKMDTESWIPYGVKVDIFKRIEQRLAFTVYMISPDGSRALSPCLRRIGIAQPGYGVMAPAEKIPRNDGASMEDGLFVVDTETGHARLLISFKDLLSRAGCVARPEPGGYYGFHVKWSPSGDRIMFIVRFKPESAGVGKTQNYLFTLNADGSDPVLALSPEAWEGGHHPNWCPDGRSIVMNLIHPRASSWRLRGANLATRIARKLGVRLFMNSRRLSFVKIDERGRKIDVAAPGIVGSGHPSIDPSSRLLVSDSYPSEEPAFGDGTVPIRGINLSTGEETCLIRIDTRPRYNGTNSEYRIDPHPAWELAGTRITFNGSVHGCRSVFVADLADLLSTL
ncbi:TolB family protein [Mycolicibacterium obuense]|uniref:Translocation protein TolB n=1 Tax=Mycolicibacterium obuense TaxID=1807 RepID=A0A0J6Z774_9MYCO|nr:hypothetical protein [Mycolicibacterium obuense]KMO80466.1 hypothetical protein MOBUDSM44075_00930 [Mycolicibacterium obuense]